ncbi:hypothetical protein CDAR_189971 [Caerostris darwini]|uniref:Uncharacterized protein n=1 Tax=Caerostris darwini TaxID=1538125 RepID=A0AAV4QNT1_9ARAC|nr:hypothetical protein CDAR_189971 [Caerostris darwini]
MSSTLICANNPAAMGFLQLFITGPKFGPQIPRPPFLPPTPESREENLPDHHHPFEASPSSFISMVTSIRMERGEIGGSAV